MVMKQILLGNKSGFIRDKNEKSNLEKVQNLPFLVKPCEWSVIFDLSNFLGFFVYVYTVGQQIKNLINYLKSRPRSFQFLVFPAKAGHRIINFNFVDLGPNTHNKFSLQVCDVQLVTVD